MFHCFFFFFSSSCFAFVLCYSSLSSFILLVLVFHLFSFFTFSSFSSHYHHFLILPRMRLIITLIFLETHSARRLTPSCLSHVPSFPPKSTFEFSMHADEGKQEPSRSFALFPPPMRREEKERPPLPSPSCAIMMLVGQNLHRKNPYAWPLFVSCEFD